MRKKVPWHIKKKGYWKKAYGKRKTNRTPKKPSWKMHGQKQGRLF